MNTDVQVRKFFPSLLSQEESDASIQFFQEMHARVGAHVKVNKSEQWPDGLGRGSYALEGEV